MLDLIMLGDADPTVFCYESANIWQFIGYFVLIFKIVIPIILIILGMLDLGKAVVGTKEDEIKKATTALAKRAVAAVVIFFIPTIVAVLFNLVTDDTAKNSWKNCLRCVTKPTSIKDDDTEEAAVEGNRCYVEKAID